jgi:hypothetical protein
MWQVRTFMAKTTPQALEYGDQHINEWITKENAKINFVSMATGQIEAKMGAKETVLFINVWYEKQGAPSA